MMTSKKKKSAAATAFMLICLTSAGASAGTIVGSPHDFQGYLWNRSGEICTPCHAPHSTKILPAPLWNLDQSIQTYIMYGRTQAAPQAAGLGRQPDGMSKICLSCHDGVVAQDSYGADPVDTADDFGKHRIGTGKSSNHPVSFTYDTALLLKDDDLHDPATRRSGLLGSSGTISGDMLFSNQMECSSCHDVHNTKAVADTKLLVKADTGSALCLTCHNK